MKKTALFIIFGLFFLPLFAQQPELGLPGDNLNLYGVLNIFQKSPTLEDFETRLNSPDSKVNNLDLNGDGQIDYIHVIDNMNGAIHDIVLRVDVNQNETQDVAVIEVERDANNQVHVQIVGDEALYGKDYIVEPQQSTPNPGYQGTVEVNRTYYAPAAWPIMGFMFAPAYVMWRSPYYWGYYPHFWHPWSPIGYSVYYGYHRDYYHYYRRTYVYSSPAAHAFYAPHRVSSVYVRQTYPAPRHESLPGNRPGNAPVHRETTPANHQTEKINQTPNNHSQSTGVHQTSNQNNNRPTEKIHQTPNNQNRQINQTSHPANNQNRQVNNQQHPANNQPRKTNQTTHPANHPASHQVKNNSQGKEPERK
jgi:hypothetical protein